MNVEDMKDFVRKNPITVGCGVLSLVLFGTIYVRSDNIPIADADLVEKSAEGERYAANIKNSAQLKEHLEALVVANKEIDSRMIRANAQGQGTNSQFFYKIEADTGVKIVDFRQNILTPAKGKAAFSSVGFTFVVQGNLGQLLQVLHALEDGTHYCRILSASCGLNGMNRNVPLTLSLNLEVLGLP